MKPIINKKRDFRTKRHCENCYTKVKQEEIYSDIYFCDNCNETFNLNEIKLLINKEELDQVISCLDLAEDTYSYKYDKNKKLMNYLIAKQEYYNNPANDHSNPLSIPRFNNRHNL